ncbi:trypsin-like peptidase domain-containing protein [Oscillibacter valericigenes]|uniref:S1C family serine protease n=1 Tax=Oscillibacter valericigenes TaxID=351091 RepID=UPI001F39EBA7|nr:serine protease [Oscillibacter valericigenes]MCF2664954.1 trypsin-like peptidase domain-containing protein [Oscillibacter valericigenes]
MKTRFFAILGALVLLVSAVPAASALEGESLRAADTLAALNIVRGDYGLDAPATRAHAAVLLVRLAGAGSKAASVTSRSPYYTAPAYARSSIAYAAGQGWITSLSAQSYRPDAPVTADAWCSMLLRMLGYCDKAGDFTPSGAAAFARRIGLLTQPLSGTLTRGQLFQSMRDALTFSYKDGSATVVERLVEQGAVSRATANALGLLTPELTARQAADRHMAAVFCLDTYETQKEIDAKEPSANASGFFISADGLAVTNYHSIADSIFATATLATGEVYPVEEVVYYDTGIDIAVLRVSRTSTEGKSTSAFACLELAGTDDIRAGDTVYTLGNPLGLGLAVSSGIISSPARDVERYTLPCVMNTADISRGSSGGALLNVYGRVIAVTSGAYTYGNNMYLAVPVDPVMDADLTVPGKTLAEVAKIESAKAEE